MYTPDWIEKFNRDPAKDIIIYGNLFTAGAREEQVFKDSLLYIDQKGPFSEKDSFVWKFYYLELFRELMNRYKKEMKISEENIRYLNVAFEDVTIGTRFLMNGYYNTAGMHFRGFFEKMVHFILIYMVESGKVDKSFLYNKEGGIKNGGLEEKIKECIRNGELSRKNPNNECKDTYDEFYFVLSACLKLYEHYSYNYVHNGSPTSNVKFDKLEFKKVSFLYKFTQIYIGRFIKVTIGETVEKYWENRILKSIGQNQKPYRNYLGSFFGENGFATNQFSYTYNIIHDDKDIYNFVVNEMKIDLNNIFSKEYLDGIDVLYRMKKKANGDHEKFQDLMFDYYEKKNK